MEGLALAQTSSATVSVKNIASQNQERESNCVDIRNVEKVNMERRSKLHVENYMRIAHKKMNRHLPKTQELLEAERKRYMRIALNGFILNFRLLSFRGLYATDRSPDPEGCTDSDESVDESLSEEEENFFELFGETENFHKYNEAIDEIYRESVFSKSAERGKKMLLSLVQDCVQPAYFAYALVLLKEILLECDILNFSTENATIIHRNEEVIRDAVQLLKRSSLMEPACKFLMGMLKRFNIGGCRGFMGYSSWDQDLRCVVDVARRENIFHLEPYIVQSIEEPGFWDRIGREWNSLFKCGLGLQRKGEYLKEMARYALLEITLSIQLRPFYNVNALKSLFQILSNDKFDEALYYHGVAILQGKFGPSSSKNIKELVEHLRGGSKKFHDGAKFLLGILPFKMPVSLCSVLSQREIQHCISMLETHIREDYVDDSCIENKKNMDKAAYCLATEYYSNESFFILQNKEKAREILTLRKMHEELNDLENGLVPLHL